MSPLILWHMANFTHVPESWGWSQCRKLPGRHWYSIKESSQSLPCSAMCTHMNKWSELKPHLLLLGRHDICKNWLFKLCVPMLSWEPCMGWLTSRCFFQGAIYGMAQSIPDRSMVTEVSHGFLDCLYSTNVHSSGQRHLNGISKDQWAVLCGTRPTSRFQILIRSMPYATLDSPCPVMCGSTNSSTVSQTPACLEEESREASLLAALPSSNQGGLACFTMAFNMGRGGWLDYCPHWSLSTFFM